MGETEKEEYVKSNGRPTDSSDKRTKIDGGAKYGLETASE